MKWINKLRLIFLFVIVYLRELMESNFHVAYDVLAPTDYYDPGVFTLAIEVSSDYQALLLANLITMTPGTICTDYRPQSQELEIHLMYLSEKEKISKRIREVYLPFVKELLP